MTDKDPDDLDRYIILHRLVKAGLQYFSGRIEVQDGHVVNLKLRIDDKEVVIKK